MMTIMTFMRTASVAAKVKERRAVKARERRARKIVIERDKE